VLDGGPNPPKGKGQFWGERKSNIMSLPCSLQKVWPIGWKGVMGVRSAVKYGIYDCFAVCCMCVVLVVWYYTC